MYRTYSFSLFFSLPKSELGSIWLKFSNWSPAFCQFLRPANYSILLLSVDLDGFNDLEKFYQRLNSRTYEKLYKSATFNSTA